jgi:hypothetical protein
VDQRGKDQSHGGIVSIYATRVDSRDESVAPIPTGRTYLYPSLMGGGSPEGGGPLHLIGGELSSFFFCASIRLFELSCMMQPVSIPGLPPISSERTSRRLTRMTPHPITTAGCFPIPPACHCAQLSLRTCGLIRRCGNLAFRPMPISGISTPGRGLLTEKTDDTDRKKEKTATGRSRCA